MKKKKFCFECDTEFTVSATGQDQVLYCPFCASELDEDTDDIFEEADE